MCDFVCGTMSPTKSLLNLSVIYYQVTSSDILGVVQKGQLPPKFYSRRHFPNFIAALKT